MSINMKQFKPDWCTFPRDGGRWHCVPALDNVTLCGIDGAYAVSWEGEPGKRICRECRERLKQMEERK
jgi:hypothetical protein